MTEEKDWQQKHVSCYTPVLAELERTQFGTDQNHVNSWQRRLDRTDLHYCYRCGDYCPKMNPEYNHLLHCRLPCDKEFRQLNQYKHGLLIPNGCIYYTGDYKYINGKYFQNERNCFTQYAPDILFNNRA